MSLTIEQAQRKLESLEHARKRLRGAYAEYKSEYESTKDMGLLSGRLAVEEIMRDTLISADSDSITDDVDLLIKIITMQSAELKQTYADRFGEEVDYNFAVRGFEPTEREAIDGYVFRKRVTENWCIEVVNQEHRLPAYDQDWFAMLVDRDENYIDLTEGKNIDAMLEEARERVAKMEAKLLT